MAVITLEDLEDTLLAMELRLERYSELSMFVQMFREELVRRVEERPSIDQQPPG